MSQIEDMEEEQADEYIADYDDDEIDVAAITPIERNNSVIYLQLDDIKSMVDKKIEEASELLGCSKDEALLLYNYFRWKKDALENSSWFDDQNKLRLKAGLPLTTMKRKDVMDYEYMCPICITPCMTSECDWLECNDMICKDCWKNFVGDKVDDATADFFWACPGHGKKCDVIVPNSFNRKYLPQSKIQLYEKKLCKSYAATNKAIKWCPAPDCLYCIENTTLITRSIRCTCSFIYCFKCGREDHTPCDCKKAEDWCSKNAAESATTKWLLLYTKMCPKCGKPIEKNQGCNFMQCRHGGCGQQFCWLCLDDWKTHGDHFKCNKYGSLKDDDVAKTDKGNVDKERSELERYIFYFERYANHDKALAISSQIMKNMDANTIKLHDKLQVQHGELSFLNESALILRDAKRTLKWSYAFGYYVGDPNAKNLFEFQQTDLEKYTEELLQILELKYGEVFNKEDVSLKEFQDYKSMTMNSSFKCNKFMTEFVGAIDEEWLNKMKAKKT